MILCLKEKLMMKSLKKELIYQSKPKTFEETKKSLFKYIESWYNNHRIQKKLGYLSPADYQKQSA